MSKKRNEVLLQLVVDEATKLRKHATKKELNNLDYEGLIGESAYDCIYGQLTGDCKSGRAYGLIRKCCTKVYSEEKGNNLRAIDLNGKPKVLSEEGIGDRLYYYSSPIENFLVLYKADLFDNSVYVKRLVKFLKGEINELKF